MVRESVRVRNEVVRRWFGVEFRLYAQFTLQDGEVVRIYHHEEREAALEAAGLTG